MLTLWASITIMALTLFTVPCLGLCQNDLPSGYPPVLTNISEKLARSFEQLDKDLSGAAGSIAATGLTGNEARASLAKLCAGKPYAVDCAAVDTRGVMVTIEPRAFRKFEGADISEQDQLVALKNTRKPVLSHVFRSEEGIDAVDMEHPVFSRGSALLGSVSILFKPGELLRSVIEPSIRGDFTRIWVMQKDGRILYDVHADDIGRMLFSDLAYKPFQELLALGEEMVRRAEGHGFYAFPDPETKQIIRKEAFWTSVGIYGTEWRIVATRGVRGN